MPLPATTNPIRTGIIDLIGTTIINPTGIGDIADGECPRHVRQQAISPAGVIKALASSGLTVGIRQVVCKLATLGSLITIGIPSSGRRLSPRAIGAWRP
ncbi:MAG: hypothetical protein E6J80_07725 [Deltaproteobacteria bacterium]|nr:MAG: hypothetical protein E6J80_07725 [Deltaproteobacteria bacterium]